MPTDTLDDPFAEVAEALSDSLAILAEEFGLEGQIPDASTIADDLRGLASSSPWDEPDSDPHAEILAAAVEHVQNCAENGTDPEEGLARLHSLLPDATEKKAVAWDESKHPRGDDGRFIGREAIKAAMKDGKKAEALRAKVTDPTQRAKLDAALSGEVHPSMLGSAKEVREKTQASKDRARELSTKIMLRPKEATAEDYRELIPHLHALTGAELSTLRAKLGASFGGKRRVGERRAALLAFAEGRIEEMADEIRDWSKVPAGSLFSSHRQRAIEAAKQKEAGVPEAAPESAAVPSAPDSLPGGAADNLPDSTQGGKTFPTADDADKWGREHYGEWAKSLSPEERKAVGRYRFSDYRAINAALRGANGETEGAEFDRSVAGLERSLVGSTGGKSTPAEVKAAVDKIDAALGKATVPEDVTVHRGVTGAFAASLKPGTEFTDHAYSSSSLSKEAGDMYAAGETVLRVNVPKGTNAAYVTALEGDKGREQELLLPRGSKYRITGETNENGTRVLTAELVPAGSAQSSPAPGEQSGTGGKAVDIHNPQSLASAVHDAAASLPDWTGNAHDPSTPYPHKVMISDLYESAKDKLGGMSLDEFKQALSEANATGAVRLSPIDMPQYAKDQGAYESSHIPHGDFRAVELPAGHTPSASPSASPSAPVPTAQSAPKASAAKAATDRLAAVKRPTKNAWGAYESPEDVARSQADSAALRKLPEGTPVVLRDGTEGVITHQATRVGLSGKTVTRPHVRVGDAAPVEYAAHDVEPIDPQHSWRSATPGQSSASKASAAKTRTPKASAAPKHDAKSGAALYQRLRSDRDLSIAEVRAEFEQLKNLPKSVIDAISREVGYTPESSKAATLRRLQTNLEDIKTHQSRSGLIEGVVSSATTEIQNHLDRQSKELGYTISPEQASRILDEQIATHRLNDEQLIQLARNVTGKGGRTAQQARERLLADMTAVHRTMESQKI